MFCGEGCTVAIVDDAVYFYIMDLKRETTALRFLFDHPLDENENVYLHVSKSETQTQPLSA